MIRKIFIGLAMLLIGSVFFVYQSYKSTLSAGSGYAAKNICSGYFLSGFSPDVTREQALKGASEILANVSHSLNEEEQYVSTRLYGFAERRAVFSDGIGCTLLPAGTKRLEQRVSPLTAPALSNNLDWPLGSNTPDLTNKFDDLINAAFEEPDAEKPRNTKAIVVVHNGKLLAEKYAEGVTSETPLIGWSMTKSVTALLAGLMVKDELLDIYSPAPIPQWSENKSDPRKNITTDQLLRMSSGLEFDEDYGTVTDVTQMLSNEPNTAYFAISKPLIAEPNTLWSYSSGTTNIISQIIKQSVGNTLQDYYTFSQQRLFAPLGIRTATLEADASGTFVTSSYLYASARDWARLGLFTLQKGDWNGTQLLPPDWVDYLVTPTQATDTNEYGAQFWLNKNPDNPDQRRTFPSLPETAYYMSGFQGQIVLIIPSENLVITRLGFTPKRNHGVEELAASIIARIQKAK